MSPRFIRSNIEKITRLKVYQENTEPCPGIIREFSCDDLKPQCFSGEVKLESCTVSGNKVSAIIVASECKEMQEGNTYTISGGRVTFNAECKYTEGVATTIVSRLRIQNVSSQAFENNQKVYEVTIPDFEIISSYERQSNQDSYQYSFGITLTGKLSQKDLKQNIEQEIIFDNFGTSLKLERVSISGKYSISTRPSWCGDGGFEVSTIDPLKISVEDNLSECPVSGKLKVNNAEITFDSDGVTIAVDQGFSEKYTCEEILNSCIYPLGNPSDLLPLEILYITG